MCEQMTNRQERTKQITCHTAHKATERKFMSEGHAVGDFTLKSMIYDERSYSVTDEELWSAEGKYG